MTGAFSMLSIYGTCAVLAGIAGRNKLLIKKEGDVTKFIPAKRALPRIIWSGAEPFVL